jgi:TatD DNase family protein
VVDDGSSDDTVARAREVGVERILTIAVCPENLDTVMELTRSADCIWGTQGIHPTDAEKYSGEVGEIIRQRMAEDRILAVGEIGLDYYYDRTDRAVQRHAFEEQLQIAVDTDMPVVVHTRDADEDTRAILGNFASRLRRKGVIHSFTAGLDLAEFCLQQGFCLGFNGITTFNRADNVCAAVAATPLDQLLLETDAPFLTPVPYRGKQNAPCYLPFIAEKCAAIKGCDVEELLAQAWRNSNALFFAEP